MGIAIETKKCERRIALVNEYTYFETKSSNTYPNTSINPNKYNAVATGKCTLKVLFLVSGFSVK